MRQGHLIALAQYHLRPGMLPVITPNTVIIGGGTKVFGIFTNPSVTVTFDAKKQ